ncbi:MAG TPA: M48 family metalloprotease [Burkholderiaceae bacterium]|nr:M48 family metalloprotease [Burkholderiaceae bacterium]
MQARHFLAALTAALLLGCTTVENPVTGRAERTVMDVQTELAEGQKAHQQVLTEFGAYKDPKVQAYVNELGQRLARQSHRSELKWTFTVLDSPVVNAFAVPGGYVYVTRGLMAYMESEADLAGVIGHEIGHVTARHGAQRATRAQTAGLGVLAATVLGAVLESRGVGGAAEAASQVSQSVAAGYLASHSREQELQADQLGAEYLARVQYDPKNMIDVIAMLRNQERFAADLTKAEGRAAPATNDWLATHPSNEQRLQEIREIAARYPGGKARDEGRSRYLQVIDGMPFGETPEQGLTRGRNFYHVPLGFALTVPQGWRAQNSAAALAMTNAQGSAGLVLRPVPPEAGKTHEEILRKVGAQEGKVERGAINGMPATRFAGTVRNQQGQTSAAQLTLVTGPQNRNYAFIHGARDAATLGAAQREIDLAESSFRPLTEADRAAARPWTLRTVPYPRGGFAELAQRSPVPHAEQQLRLLNGVYVEGQPKAGEPVKVVE